MTATKPSVRSHVWTDVASREKQRRWHVEFVDGCGCTEEEDFPAFLTAVRFALHLAGGGDRWEFVA